VPELLTHAGGRRAGRVIFIDAKADRVPGAIEERPVDPAATGGPFTHHATLITIVGGDFEIGHPLSPPVGAALETLISAADSLTSS